MPSLDAALGSAHAQRPLRVGRHLNHQFAVAQDDQALVWVELHIHRALRIQAQAAAIGQGECLALAARGVQVGQQVVAQRAARRQP